MLKRFFKIRFYVYLLGTFFVSSVFFGGNSYAEDDLLWQLIEPSYYSETTLNMGKNSKTVGNEVLEGSYEVDLKVKKVVITGDNGELLCHGGPCPKGCEVYDKNKDDICPWQHKLVEFDAGKQTPIVVKVTKLLLILVIALSVTMILYNGMIYIVQSGQGKDGKSLMKNIALIVVGILISFFSVLIIRLIQSIPGTLDEELKPESSSTTDNGILSQKVD